MIMSAADNPEFTALAGHITRLRAALLRYRFSREHEGCQLDMRCALCRLADDVLGELLP
jgi:hypothetical protein